MQIIFHRKLALQTFTLSLSLTSPKDWIPKIHIRKPRSLDGEMGTVFQIRALLFFRAGINADKVLPSQLITSISTTRYNNFVSLLHRNTNISFSHISEALTPNLFFFFSTPTTVRLLI